MMFGYFKGIILVVFGFFSWIEFEMYLLCWNFKFDFVNDIDGWFFIKYDKMIIVKFEQVYDENFFDDKVGVIFEVLFYFFGFGEIFVYVVNVDEVVNGLW